MTKDFLDYEDLYGDLINKSTQMCQDYLMSLQENHMGEIVDEAFLLNFIDGLINALQSKNFKININKKYRLEELRVIKKKLENITNLYYEGSIDSYIEPYRNICQRLLFLWEEYESFILKLEQKYAEHVFDMSKEGNICVQCINRILKILCAVSTLEYIYRKFGYHILDDTLRLCIATWEGDINSFSANILKGIAKLLIAFGDELDQNAFKEKIGRCSIKEISRNASERANGSLGYAEAMLVIYNKRMRTPLHYGKLYNKKRVTLPEFINRDDDDIYEVENEEIECD